MKNENKHMPEYLKAVDAICMQCAANTLETDICELCPVRLTVEGRPPNVAVELLDALKDVMSDPYFAKASTRYVNARDAIAKAEGKA